MKLQVEQLFGIKDKVFVITGGEGILGSTMAKALAANGAKVGILGINEPSANKIVNEIRESGGEAIPLIVNVLDQNQLLTARETVLSKWQRIDVVINAAGGNMEGATIASDQTIFDLDISEMEKVTDLNFKGTVLPSIVFGKTFAQQNEGSIINISSMASMRVISGVVGYSAAKSAVDNFTRWMAVEMARKFGEGIRVNAIAPGFFITHQNRRLLTNEDGSLTNRGKKIIELTPFKRFGKPEELVGAIIWLSSKASQFITGTVIPIDGGFNIFSGI